MKRAVSTLGFLAGFAPAAMAAGLGNASFETYAAGQANVLCPAGIAYCGQYNAGNTGIAGWTIGGSSVDIVGPLAWTASDGEVSVDLSGANAGSLSQTFDTVAGTVYEVQFDLGGNFYGGPAVKTGIVSAASQSQALSFDNSNSSALAMGWQTQTFTFTAIAASTTLTFTSTTSGPAGLALDRVSVTAVPEPQTALLFLAGLGLLVRARRRG